MKKVLPNTEKTKKYLESLPQIHLVACWAKWGILSFPFTGKFEERNGILIPLVYDYDDHNGTCDNFYLRPITWTTTGRIFTWLQNKTKAQHIADLLNKEYFETMGCER